MDSIKITPLSAKLMQRLIQMSLHQIDGKLFAQYERLDWNINWWRCFCIFLKMSFFSKIILKYVWHSPNHKVNTKRCKRAADIWTWVKKLHNSSNKKNYAAKLLCDIVLFASESKLRFCLSIQSSPYKVEKHFYFSFEHFVISMAGALQECVETLIHAAISVLQTWQHECKSESEWKLSLYELKGESESERGSFHSLTWQHVMYVYCTQWKW